MCRGVCAILCVDGKFFREIEKGVVNGETAQEFDEKEWRQFETLCGIMCTRDEICSVLNISDKTLSRLTKEKYGLGFDEAREKFSSNGRASLRRLQFQHAQTKPNDGDFSWKSISGAARNGKSTDWCYGRR